MRLLKIVALVVLSLLVLAAGAVWYLSTSFDSDRVKSELSQAVADRYGRALVFDGPLTLTFWPRLALDAKQVTLSARDAPTVLAARVARVRVHVGLLPLLARRVDVQEMRLEGVQLHFARDMLKTLEALQGQPAAASIKDAPVAFNVHRVSVTDASLELVDPVQGMTLQLSRVTAFVGPIGKGLRGVLGVEGDAVAHGLLPAQGRFRMTAGFGIDRTGLLSLNNAGVDFDGEALGYRATTLALTSGGAAIDRAGRWQGKALALRVHGQGRAGTSTITAEVPAWRWEDGLHLAQAAATFQRDGERGGALAARLANLRPLPEGWQADTLSLEGNLRRDGRSHAISLQAVPQWRSPDDSLLLNGLDAQFGWPGAGDAPARRLQITGQLAWQPLNGPLDASLAFNDGAQRLAGSVRIAPDASPALQFELHAPRLALDAYRAELAGLWSARSLPPFAGRVRADRVEADGWVLESVVLPVAGEGAALRFGPFDGAVFNGRVSGQLAHDAEGAGLLELKATGVALEQWPRAAEAKAMLSGGLDADLRLRFDADAAAPWPTAQGRMRFVLNGGAWQAEGLVDALRAPGGPLALALAGAGAGPALPIRQASADVTVSDGAGQVDALSIRSDALQLTGTGTVGLADGALDLALTAQLTERPEGMRKSAFAKLQRQHLPLRLSGTLAAPQWQAGDHTP
ncbi:AsmA family protein [Denitromonas iodatirespirans]|uniref:AsmA family protein n=1 Tax=Denitromonas iodatirespirans TaxID=2795389 RepID=A0A944DDY8_DENI1|nr:AsmA family protein [Denitromonas iodatirespirans]MBT0963306.1 AsmA family protein [Denitromonas iodatirespirans]